MKFIVLFSNREFTALQPGYYIELTDISAFNTNPALTDDFTYSTWIRVDEAVINYEYLLTINNGNQRRLAFTIAKYNRFEIYYTALDSDVVRLNFYLREDTIIIQEWNYIAVTINYPNIKLYIDCIEFKPGKLIYTNSIGEKVRLTDENGNRLLFMPKPIASFTSSSVVS